MKISISLSDEDVAYLDAETSGGRFASRSAAVAAAIGWMRRGDLVSAYDQAFDEWADSDDAAAWDASTSDGVR